MTVAKPVASPRVRTALGGAGLALCALIVASRHWPSRRRRPRPSRTPSIATASPFPRVAGTTRDPARSTPSAPASSTRKRAPWPAPHRRWCWRSASSPLPDDAGKSPADLAQRYGEAQFTDELPEAICGESDRAAVKVDNAKQVLEEARVVYTADVTCPEIKFLGLGERRAMVQFLLTPGPALPADGAGAEGGLRAAQGGRRRLLRELPRLALEQDRLRLSGLPKADVRLRRSLVYSMGEANGRRVVVFPGSNCDRDVKVALEAVAGQPVSMVWHADAAAARLRPDRAARAVSPTATTCAAAPWPRIPRSCATWSPGPRPARPCSASATASRC